jgi:hypothetical protein
LANARQQRVSQCTGTSQARTERNIFVQYGYGFDNAFEGPDYNVSLDSIRRNLHSSWTVDHDPFRVNQLGHAYQGSVYYDLARSNGFNFWESFGFAFAGSAIWEIAAETTPPSKNDQITTSIGGTFLGESLFRMAHLMLERGTVLPPR